MIKPCYKLLSSLSLLTLLSFTPAFSQDAGEDELEPFLEQEGITEDQRESFFINPDLQQDFTIVVSNHNFNLNPQTASYSIESEILTGLYDTLFTYNPLTLDPEYGLCRDFRISRDNKRWTFILREDAFFSNGEHITANTVKESFLSLIEEPNAPYSSMLDIIKGAEAYRTGKGDKEKVGIYVQDDYTLLIHLNNPASHFPKLLCMTAFSIVSKDKTSYSGPFVLESRDQQSIVLTKNQKYYDKDKTPLNKIIFHISDDIVENAHLFNTGDADWISSSADLSKLISKTATHIDAEFATEYLFFKLHPGRPVEEETFRQALLEAAPWDKLRTDTFVKATSLVYPLNGYPQVQGYVYSDKFEAKDLMEKAREKLGIGLEDTITITFAITENEHMLKEAELLREAWAPLGVELKTIVLSSHEYLYELSNTQADLYSYTWIGDFADPLAFLELFRGSSSLNNSNWSNEEYDKYLQEASLYTDENHNINLSKAEQVLLDQAMVLPIQHPVSLNIIDLNAVGGWAGNAFDIHPLKYLYRKECKVKVPNLV